MAIKIYGNGTITGLSTGGLPDGSVDADTLASTLDLSGNTITLPSGTGGKVLQVVSSVLNTEVSTTNNTYTGTGLSVDITPSSTSSKIVLMFTSGKVRTGQVHGYYMFSIFRDSTNIHNDHGAVCRGRYATYSNVQHALSITALDSPSSTSEITYEVKFRHATSGEVVAMNQVEDTWQPNASLVAMEIAG